jgi:hypothetical protein
MLMLILKNFKEPFSRCIDGKGWDTYYVHDGFLFWANKICIPACSVRQVLLQEAHVDGLVGHFGVIGHALLSFLLATYAT